MKSDNGRREVRERVLGVLDRAPLGRLAHAPGFAGVARAVRPMVNRMVPETPQVVTVKSGVAQGLRLRVRPRTEKFYWLGTHETATLEAIAAHARPGWTVWDVGAHLGYVALAAARIVHPGGTVVAFEPVPGNRERLADSVALNDAAGVVVAPFAIAREGGEGTLHEHDTSLEWTLRPTERAGRVPVTLLSLDDALERYPAPRLVKLDAEGVELEALEGATRLLTEHRPLLIVESADEGARATLGRLLPGYALAPLSPFHWLATPA
jgi:FkbM family methyltransferase